MDSFTTSSYVVGVEPLRRALESRGHQVAHLPAHLVPARFPADADALAAYDVVVLSDIGANSCNSLPRSSSGRCRARTGSARSAAGCGTAAAS